ncbi:uncharacterized protein LOC108628951 [Ceratina calcarata]|uniref:Uncharacterized protein LOC108628951 n=1 Tax=Ceratina calcarata TaxID=156304 RepID=A0AAJ7J8J3_9HYME|nr:uncharacterized protein LOC108628951 [Ceratina calcarata]
MRTTITLLLLQTLSSNHRSSAEWIDMPEFSDDKKIYRTANAKEDHFYKFAEKNTADAFMHARDETRTTAEHPNDDGRKNSIWLEPNKTTTVTINNATTTTTTTESSRRKIETTIPSTIENAPENEQCIDQPSSFTSNDTDLFKHLPVELLKSVHRTLMESHKSTSSRGKIEFLKTFENTLIGEIESRITKVTTIVRQKRGAAEHHGYDHGHDHENATGFPSTEGALMAISFLTFAVYLVRLVMLLFRNMNNPTPATTTGGTFLIGRRKRSSTSKFDDDDATTFLRGLHSSLSSTTTTTRWP